MSLSKSLSNPFQNHLKTATRLHKQVSVALEQRKDAQG